MASACSLNDGAHLLSVERLHGRGADVAAGDGLQHHGGGRLVIGEVGHHHQVVLAQGPQQLADLAAIFLDHAAVVLGPADGVADVLDALLGEVDEGDVGGHDRLLSFSEGTGEASILSSLAGRPAKSTSASANGQG